VQLVEWLIHWVHSFPVLKKGVSRKILDIFPEFLAGVMFVVITFSFVILSIEIGGPLKFVTNFLLGEIFIGQMKKITI
jgi:polyferredoxin